MHMLKWCKTKVLQTDFAAPAVQMLNMRNVQGGGSQGTRSQSSAKVSVIIITVCAVCWGAAFHNPLGGSRKFGKESTPEQDSPNIQCQDCSNLWFCCLWSDKTRQEARREETQSGAAGVAALLFNSKADRVGSDCRHKGFHFCFHFFATDRTFQKKFFLNKIKSNSSR